MAHSTEKQSIPRPERGSAAIRLTRRDLLGRVVAGGGMAAATLLAGEGLAIDGAKASEPEDVKKPHVLKGRIQQSICRWCHSKLSLDQLAKAAADMGYKSIELIGPNDWPTVKRYGLTCAMAPGTGPIQSCINRKENHPRCVAELRKNIEIAAEAGLPNVIALSGNRDGLPDDVGIENCVIALKEVAGFAEEKKVTICLELLNSKVDHKDYHCDHTVWGVEVCKRVGSPRCKLLYDVYHMQIMEGDIIRTIRKYAEYIGHYHTGGNPGRNEIDETQEINYPAVMRAIAETKFEGYVGQEFVPKGDSLTSLRRAFEICDV